MEMQLSIEEFLNYLTKYKRVSDHTVTAYRGDLDQLTKYLQYQYRIASCHDITSDMMRSWLVRMIEKHYAAESINRKIAAVRSYFRFLRSQGKLSKNPAQILKNVRTKQRLPNYLQQNELLDLLNHKPPQEFEAYRNYAILWLLYGCGLRRSEILSIMVTDWHHDYIRVHGKGGKDRLLPVPDQLKQILKTYLTLRKDLEVEPVEDNLFVRTNGKAMYPKLVYNIVRQYLAKFTKLSQKSPHTLRHSFATHMVNQGADINAVKELLGHASLAATQIYTHTDIQELMRIYRNSHPKSATS